MKYLTSLLRPFKAVIIALGTLVFVSGCETTSGAPELTNAPQPAPRQMRTTAPAKTGAVAAPAATSQEPAAALKCNPAPVPGVKPKKYCDY